MMHKNAVFISSIEEKLEIPYTALLQEHLERGDI